MWKNCKKKKKKWIWRVKNHCRLILIIVFAFAKFEVILKGISGDSGLDGYHHCHHCFWTLLLLLFRKWRLRFNHSSHGGKFCQGSFSTFFSLQKHISEVKSNANSMQYSALKLSNVYFFIYIHAQCIHIRASKWALKRRADGFLFVTFYFTPILWCQTYPMQKAELR